MHKVTINNISVLGILGASILFNITPIYADSYGWKYSSDAWGGASGIVSSGNLGAATVSYLNAAALNSAQSSTTATAIANAYPGTTASASIDKVDGGVSCAAVWWDYTTGMASNTSPNSGLTMTATELWFADTSASASFDIAPNGTITPTGTASAEIQVNSPYAGIDLIPSDSSVGFTNYSLATSPYPQSFGGILSNTQIAATGVNAVRTRTRGGTVQYVNNAITWSDNDDMTSGYNAEVFTTPAEMFMGKNGGSGNAQLWLRFVNVSAQGTAGATYSNAVAFTYDSMTASGG